MDDKLKTLLADPVAAAVRFEVVNQEIDWFDLRIVIDVEGVQLSKEQIRALVAARGGYVRMDDGGWMRLEIKLDNDQRDAVTRLGLDPFDLSGETHRMHAMQLADPKAAEVFTRRHGNASRTVPRKSRSTSSRMFPPSSRPPCARIRWKGSISWLTLPRTGSAAFWRMTWAWVKQSSPSLMSSGCVKNSPAKQIQEKAVIPPVLIVCPKSVLDVWAGETENLRQACASSSSAARTRPIWKTSRRTTTWSWSTTPSSASAGKP